MNDIVSTRKISFLATEMGLGIHILGGESALPQIVCNQSTYRWDLSPLLSSLN